MNADDTGHKESIQHKRERKRQWKSPDWKRRNMGLYRKSRRCTLGQPIIKKYKFTNKLCICISWEETCQASREFRDNFLIMTFKLSKWVVNDHTVNRAQDKRWSQGRSTAQADRSAETWLKCRKYQGTKETEGQGEKRSSSYRPQLKVNTKMN